MENTQGSLSGEAAQEFLTALQTVARTYHEDSQFRAQLEASPRTALTDSGVELPPAIDIQVFANTADVFHVVLPPDPTVLISDDSLLDVAGGRYGEIPRQRSALSTVSTFPSTISTGSTVDAGPI